jgi:hypothetical protein
MGEGKSLRLKPLLAHLSLDKWMLIRSRPARLPEENAAGSFWGSLEGLGPIPGVLLFF